LEEIQRRIFEKYAFCVSCLGYRDKAFSLILLVLPYTILTQALNCLFVSPYMKMLRHYLFVCIFALIVELAGWRCKKQKPKNHPPAQPGPRSRRFSPSGFLFLRSMCPCGPVSPPPLEWFPFPPLVAAVLLTPKGAESPGSGRIGVIGALVFFPSEAVQDKLQSP